MEEQMQESRKRHREDYDDRRAYYEEKREMYPLLKILVPNYAAGAIIGKGGQNISQLQSTYGAKLKLSQNNEHYPGTQERIGVITGDVEKVIDLHKYVMDKIRNEAGHAHGVSMDDRSRQMQAKIIVPNGTAGLLIGKGGSMIRSLMEQSGAKIVISNKDQEQVHGERVVTISGSSEENEEACRLIIDKIATDPSNMMNRTLSYSGGSHYGAGHMGSHSGGSQRSMDTGFNTLSSVLGNLAANKNPPSNLLGIGGVSGLSGPAGLLRGGNSLGLGANPLALQILSQGGASANLPYIKTKVTAEMHIPDSLVGSILGKGGKTIVEFINYSGAKIQFSGKGEFVPGTNDRILTIEGDFTSTQVAHFLICQKILQSEAENK